MCKPTAEFSDARLKSTDELTKKRKECKTFNIIHQNVCSIRNKIGEIEVFLKSSGDTYDVLCFSEHFMSADETASLSIGDYTLISSFSRKKHTHGGVMIMVRNNIICSPRTDLVEASVEMTCEFAAIEIKHINLIILTVYRPPGGDFNLFLDIMNSILDILTVYRTYVVVLGDFNIHFNLNNNRKKGFMDLMNSYGFTEHIFDFTRQSACLDNVLVNFTEVLDFGAGIVDAIVSDHRAVHIKIKNLKNPVSQSMIYHQPITVVGTNHLFDFLSNMNWSFVKSDTSANIKCDLFFNILCKGLNLCFPVRKMVCRSNVNVRWYNHGLAEMREKLRFLNDLHNNFKLPETAVLRNQYRTQYRQKIAHCKLQANSAFIQRAENKVRAAWQITNDYRGATKKQIPNEISADMFNSYFTDVAQTVLQSLPQINIEPSKYLGVFTIKPPFGGFSFREVTIIEVRDAINSLKSKNSRDIFGYSTVLLKKIKNTMIIPLMYLINSCIREGVYPDLLKKSKVVPIHKRGDYNDINNYRPITLVPTLSKVFEYLLKDQMYTYFSANDLFSKSQFGFMKSKSTTGAILSLLQYVVEGLEECQHIGAILCDLSKAFDCICHRLLLQKLEYYGFHPRSVKLIQNYLTNRAQQTLVGGKLSESLYISSGVPQGSVLGPLLFLIYINDIETATDDKLVLFADDTTSISKSKNLEHLILQMKQSVLSLERWFNANGLSLNVNKTENIIFSLRPVISDLDLRNTCRADSVRFLGVYLDNTLVFDTHVDQVSKKLSKSIFLLKNLKRTVDNKVLIMAFHALFQSHCNYGILAWGHAAQASRIFKLQRRAVRVLENLHYRADVRQTFIKLNILTLPSMYILSCLTYVKNYLDEYSSHCELHNHNTRYKGNIRLKYLRLGKSRMSVNHFGPKFYNKLPNHVRNLDKKQFCMSVKKYLLSNAFYSSQEFLDNVNM